MNLTPTDVHGTVHGTLNGKNDTLTAYFSQHLLQSGLNWMSRSLSYIHEQVKVSEALRNTVKKTKCQLNDPSMSSGVSGRQKCCWRVVMRRRGWGKLLPKIPTKTINATKKNWAKTKTRAKRAMLKTHIKKIEKKIYCTSWPRKKIRAQKNCPPPRRYPWSMIIHAQC